MKTIQPEFAVASNAFNLAMQPGIDIDRVLAEDRKRIADDCQRREYQAKMQRTFESCPGFQGADLPSAPGNAGRVVVDPRLAVEALSWLKRRFSVSENLSLSTDNGLAIDVLTRRVGGKSRQSRRFSAVEQFEFAILEATRS